MKKQILGMLLILAATSISFAAPVAIGDVRFQDDLVILNQHIVCQASTIPTNDIRPETIVSGTFTFVRAAGKTIHISGRLDGDLFEIKGNVDESVNVSLQAAAQTAEGKPSYRFSTSGLFTNMTAHAARVKNVGLSILLNGKQKEIGCSIH